MMRMAPRSAVSRRLLVVGAVGRVGGDDAAPDVRAEEVGGQASAGGAVRRRLLEVGGRLGEPDAIEAERSRGFTLGHYVETVADALSGAQGDRSPRGVRPHRSRARRGPGPRVGPGPSPTYATIVSACAGPLRFPVLRALPFSADFAPGDVRHRAEGRPDGYQTGVED